MTEHTTEKKPMILGLGGEGAAIIDHLSLIPGIEAHTLALIDTDRSVVDHSTAQLKLSAASDWGVGNGSGCGGDVIRGERSIARERHNIAEFLESASFLTVCCGLGGGTATGGIRTIASLAKAQNLPCMFLVTMPFSFEAYSRRNNAAECVKELLTITDIFLTLPNDLLFASLPPDTPAKDAFNQAASSMAYTVFGAAELMRCKSVIGADYAAFMAPVHGMRCDCALGIGSADASDGLERCSVALERMIKSPFLGGMSQLKKADAAFLILSGGDDLTLAEMKRALELAAGLFPKNVELLSGTSVSPSMNGRIQLTAITLKYENPPEKKQTRAAASPFPDLPSAEEKKPEENNGSGELMQEEFALTSYSRGIFENMPPTRYRDCDLDVPTFQRQNVSIDRGKTGL